MGEDKMQSNVLIGVLVLVGILCVLKVVIRSKLLDLLTRICVGVLMISVLNCLLPHYMIALNIYTVGFVTCLGLPGVMTLFMLQFII